MQYHSEFAFILPLDDDERPEEPKYTDDTVIPLNEIEINKVTRRKTPRGVQIEPPSVTTQPSRPRFLTYAWYVTRWYILLFLAILSSFYSIFHFALDDVHKEIILRALAFCDDWKQLIFFFGIFVSFAVKKVSDVSSVRFYIMVH